MAIASGSDTLGDPSGVAGFLWALTVWVGDPAVLTAIASLLTAVAAFWRSRHRRAVEHTAPSEVQHLGTSLSRAYSTLHEVEEKIREELLQQLQALQEEAERIGDDLAHYRHATAALEETIIHCPDHSCPVRQSLQDP